MKKIVTLATMLAALAVLLPLAAHAQSKAASRYNQTTIIADSCAAGMADSSLILDVRGKKIIGLAIRVSGPAGATVAGCISMRVNAGNSSTANDSFTVRLFPDSIGSKSIGTNVPTAAQLGSYEVPVTIVADGGVAAKWGSATGGFVTAERFQCPRGDCTFDFVSFRWRTFTCSTGNAPLIKVWLYTAPR